MQALMLVSNYIVYDELKLVRLIFQPQAHVLTGLEFLAFRQSILHGTCTPSINITKDANGKQLKCQKSTMISNFSY